MFKHGDIPITFGVVSPWSKLCFVVVDVVIILCDHISWTLQLMDVELVPLETAKIGIYKDVLKYSDIHIRFWNCKPMKSIMFRGFCTYSLVTLCDRISWNLQPMDMELVLLDKAKMEFYKNIIKSYSSDVELWAYELLPYFMVVAWCVWVGMALCLLIPTNLTICRKIQWISKSHTPRRAVADPSKSFLLKIESPYSKRSNWYGLKDRLLIV